MSSKEDKCKEITNKTCYNQTAEIQGQKQNLEGSKREATHQRESLSEITINSWFLRRNYAGQRQQNDIFKVFKANINANQEFYIRQNYPLKYR